MSKQLEELIELHKLEPLEVGLFRGESTSIGFPNVYGGQVIGQALYAAGETVKDRTVHSFHSYFLHPGDVTKPIIYDVETLRDGKSLSTRRVKAVQNGRSIFYLTASYIGDDEGFEHQETTMPDVPGPENLPNETELAKSFSQYMSESMRNVFCADKAIESRPVVVNNPLQPEKLPAKQYIWIKANGSLDSVSPIMHQCLLSYISDWGFLVTALFPHEISLFTPKLQVATIDHSMWFHRPFKMDEWLLYVIDSTVATNTRGLVKGEIFNRDGQLVATAVQEGIMRFRQK